MPVTGVVGCKIVYKDVNVTSVLAAGEPVRVCNADWASFAAFDKVAVINGSVLASHQAEVAETQMMGIVQLLRTVDATITLSWFANSIKEYVGCTAHFDPPQIEIKTPQGITVRLLRRCSGGEPPAFRWNISYVKLDVLNPPVSVTDALQVFPVLDLELVAALHSLPGLKILAMCVSSGTLLPQLGALTSLVTIQLSHYCLRGPLPARLLKDMTNLRSLTITPVTAAAGATDPAGGLCGHSGTLPDVSALGLKLDNLELSYNQLTGQLPLSLLSLAGEVALQHNRFSGSIPGSSQLMPRLHTVDLSNNNLEVTYN
jgi:hypothetical protein